jgi:hypothetical protein
LRGIQGQKGACPRRESFVERKPRRLARQHGAEPHSNTIDELMTSQSGRGRSVPVPGSVSRFPCGREPEQKQQLPPSRKGSRKEAWGAIGMVTGVCLMLRVPPPLTSKRSMGRPLQSAGSPLLCCLRIGMVSFSRERPRISRLEDVMARNVRSSFREMAHPGCMPQYPGQRTHRNR